MVILLFCCTYMYINVTLCIGRHCCLWCSVTSEKLKVPRAARAVTVRSLDTLARCHSEYLADGADLKKAKQHQNVIGESFFDIPLSQVNHFVTGQFFLIYTSNYIGLSTWSSYNLRNLSKTLQSFRGGVPPTRPKSHRAMWIKQ